MNNNPQNWFHIKALEASIDLRKIISIDWNYEWIIGSSRTFVTKFTLGSGITYNSDTGDVEDNEWWLKLDSDRQALYAALFPDGDCPIALRLN